ncbi:uncharacterized protein LOC123228190 [Mangifera indica]|uniref:uncharacterized protein LOC123228190 n=1 Tax=Mangifera indica TaxID=29780 RepID=UPI001CF937E8|nr:uncharacterized protein LOC123228190 [Mangifera indica]
MAETKFQLKLLVDNEAKKVLFAEAGKEIADFLCYLLSLPVGTIARLLEKNMVGCLGNLYESIKGLSETYMQPNQDKNSLLNPKSPISSTEIPLLLSDHEFESRKFYLCDSCSNSSFGCRSNSSVAVADNPKIVCPSCKRQMTRQVPYLTASSKSVGANTAAVGEGGFVKGVVTYMIMDNLVLKPMSTISSIALLNKFNVKDVHSLEEKVIDFGIKEGVKLLKTSLECKNVLTSVFLSSNEIQKSST